MFERITNIIFFFIFLTAALHADMSVILSYESKNIPCDTPEKNLAMTTLEAGPSAVVAGSIVLQKNLQKHLGLLEENII